MLDHEKWLAFAEIDYKSAKSLYKDELFSTAAYHCQQAAEKALKAYLVHKKQQILKTHDLIKLGALCALFDKDFQKLGTALEVITPFATKFRYPSEFDIPDKGKVDILLEETRFVLTFVTKKIATSMTGQMEIIIKLPNNYDD